MLDCGLSLSRSESFGFALENGMKIKVMGNPEIRSNRGKFTLHVDKIQLLGEGALKKAYELLKKKLQIEGLFDRKRLIPNYVQKIGIITSRSGVVIEDFKNNLGYFGFKIYFYDSRVEGNEAVHNIVEGIEWLNKNKKDLDVIAIIRGGGSLESLQAFNNELVCRAVFASKIPIILGIGHDVNVPISSLTADLFVSTPTAAANILNKPWENLERLLPSIEERLLNNFQDYLEVIQNKSILLKDNLLINFGENFKNDQQKINLLIKDVIYNCSMVFDKTNNLFEEIKNIFDNLNQKRIRTTEKIKNFKEIIFSSFLSIIKQKRDFIRSREEQLVLADPRRNLKLGYSIVFDKNKKVIKDASDIKLSETIYTKLYKGEIQSEIKKINSN